MVGSGDRIHLNDVLASIGIVQLGRLEELNGRRKALAAAYKAAFEGLPGFHSIGGRPETGPSWHMFTGLIDGRDRFVTGMMEWNIAIGVHYYPLHLYPLFHAYRVSLP